MKFKSVIKRKLTALIIALVLISLNSCFETNRSKFSKKASLNKVTSKVNFNVHIQELQTLTFNTDNYQGKLEISDGNIGITYFRDENSKKTILFNNFKKINFDETSKEK